MAGCQAPNGVLILADVPFQATTVWMTLLPVTGIDIDPGQFPVGTSVSGLSRPGVGLHIAAPLALVVLQLTPGGIEAVAHRGIRVL